MQVGAVIELARRTTESTPHPPQLRRVLADLPQRDGLSQPEVVVRRTFRCHRAVKDAVYPSRS